MKFLDETQLTCMEKTLGWLEKHFNWLNITPIHTVIFIIISYVMNLIYFFALSDEGRGYYSNTPFILLFASSSSRSYCQAPIFACSLFAVYFGCLLQMYQKPLPETEKLVWYYNSFLKTCYKPGNKLSFNQPNQLLMKKWNNWILLAWLLTTRVISTPPHHYKTIKKWICLLKLGSNSLKIKTS